MGGYVFDNIIKNVIFTITIVLKTLHVKFHIKREPTGKWRVWPGFWLEITVTFKIRYEANLYEEK